MKSFLFWSVFLVVAISCPLLWRITQITTEPAGVGRFVTEHLPVIRASVSIGLAIMLCLAAQPAVPSSANNHD